MAALFVHNLEEPVQVLVRIEGWKSGAFPLIANNPSLGGQFVQGLSQRHLADAILSGPGVFAWQKGALQRNTQTSPCTTRLIATWALYNSVLIQKSDLHE
jgi:hypothetical protein